MGIFDFLFGAKERQVKALLDNGALILDVRTQAEWDQGHIKNAKHIVLDDLRHHVEALQKLNKPIITCCASGVRAVKAAEFLNLNNIIATNGGSWKRLEKHIRR